MYNYVHVITHVHVQYTVHVPIKTRTNTCTEEHVVMGNTEKVHTCNKYTFTVSIANQY